MVDTMRLTCPTCGAKLEVTEDMERFACLHCGNEMLVIRRGGAASIEPVVRELERVRDGAVRTASELAIERLDRELIELRREKGQTGLGSCVLVLACSGVVALAACIALFAVGSQSPDTGSSLVCVGLMVAPAMVGLAFAFRRLQKGKQQEEELDSLIAGKIQERRRHQEVVGNVPRE